MNPAILFWCWPLVFWAALVCPRRRRTTWWADGNVIHIEREGDE